VYKLPAHTSADVSKPRPATGTCRQVAKKLHEYTRTPVTMNKQRRGFRSSLARVTFARSKLLSAILPLVRRMFLWGVLGLYSPRYSGGGPLRHIAERLGSRQSPLINLAQPCG